MFIQNMFGCLRLPWLAAKRREAYLENEKKKPAAFFLAGDSTTAAPTFDGGGWGNGFLERLHSGSTGANFARNGTTTVSFVQFGEWAKVLAAVEQHAQDYNPYVTIQFGHNDMGQNISMPEYAQHLNQMGLDVRAAGGEPIFVTPLSRRLFESGHVVEDLAPPAAFTIGVARHLEAYCIDLNAASTHYLNAIGEENAMLYNSVEGDVTHVNHSGQTLFGNMVSLMIRGLGNGELGTWTTPDEEIVKAIEKGCFILPE